MAGSRVTVLDVDRRGVPCHVSGTWDLVTTVVGEWLRDPGDTAVITIWRYHNDGETCWAAFREDESLIDETADKTEYQPPEEDS